MIVQSGARSARRSRLLGTAFPPFSKPLLRVVTAASLAGLAMPALAGNPSVLPTGGAVASGAATIAAPSNNTLTVTQTSSKAIINWQSFSVGQPNTVTIDNGTGATLNRVTGTARSTIDGNLNATGSVYLLNPNGVVVSKTGVVNVGKNFVASTLGTSDAQFNAAGPLTLSGTSQKAVVNFGKIGSLGGDVALVAQTALNAGTIAAPQGSAGVLAGTQVTLNDTTLDDGKFSVDVGDASNTAGNTGNIAAAEAELRANGGNVYALAGNSSGVIAATGVSSNDGKVFLTAGDTGSVKANATISAQTSSGAGGTVDTSGGKVDFTGINVHAGNWVIDPVDLDLDAAAASTIVTNLNANTSVTIKTTATGTDSSVSAGTVTNPGNGDITVDSEIDWSTGASLTLSAYRHINVNANLASSGGGNINLRADNTGAGTGSVSFGAGDTASTSGAVNILYDPSNYSAPVDYSANIGGGAQLTAYMLVNSTADLAAIGANTTTLGGTYALGKSIDYGFLGPLANPIGNDTTPFTGVFDGQNLAISNLKVISPSGDFVGLFGEVDGTVRHLTVNDPTVVGHFYVGGLAGRASNATIEDVSVTGGQVGGTELIGGMVGWLTGTSTIDNSNENTRVLDQAGGGNSYFGGVAGDVDANASISNTIGRGTVQASDFDFNVGGIVGDNYGTLTNVQMINDTFTTSSISAITIGQHTSSVGGLVGTNRPGAHITESSADVYIGAFSPPVGAIGGIAGNNMGSIEQSTSTGVIIASDSSDSFVGGLAGENQGTITNSSSTVNVTGGSGVGGLVGWNLAGATISGSSAGGCGCTGLVIGQTQVGGLVGINDGAISNSNSTNGVNQAPIGQTVVGGLVGANAFDGTITQSDASGDVYGDTNVGGLVGENDGSITQSQSDSYVQGATANVGGLVGMQDGAGTITFSLASGFIDSGDANNVGGLVGNNEHIVTESAAITGGVNGNTNVGGLVGLNFHTGTISKSWATNAVSGGSDVVGGLVGDNAGGITTSWSGNSFGSGVTGNGNATGGLVATNEATGTVTYSYSVANAQGPGYVAGLIGVNLNATPGAVDNVYASGRALSTAPAGQPAGLIGDDTHGTVSNAYWDTATTGQTVAFAFGSGTEANIGSVDGSLPPGVTGSAFSQASYGYFDFTPSNNTWFMIGGDPLDATKNGGTRPFLQGETWSTGPNQYLITNAHQLQLMAMAPGASYELTGIDAGIEAGDTADALSGPSPDMWGQTGFAPIYNFTGSLDGKGGAIQDVSIASTADEIGLFGTIGATGSVSNIALDSVAVSGGSYVGGLAGKSAGTITGVEVDGQVSGTNEVGGIVGENQSGAMVTWNPNGPFGFPQFTEAFVSVLGADDVGGLAGSNDSGATISYSVMVASSVNAAADVGGLVGNNAGVIDHSAVSRLASASDAVIGNENVGGFVGVSTGTISNSYASIPVGDWGNMLAVTSNAGGLVGDAEPGSVIEDSYATGNVLGTVNTGGLVGYANGATISDVYAIGETVTVDATSSDATGGLVGRVDNTTTINFGYAAGSVSSASGTDVGGLVGASDALSSESNLYWDTDSTGQVSAGAVTGGGANAVGGGVDAYDSSNYGNLNDGHWVFVGGTLGGDGTRPMLASEVWQTAPNDYLITNAHQLQLIAANPNGSYQIAFPQVDASATFNGGDVWDDNVGWVPIFQFGGTLEGNGGFINALTAARPGTNSQALFDMIMPGATVQDLFLQDFNILGGNFAGTLAGSNFGTISNVLIGGGSVEGNNYVGGLVGSNRAGGVITGFATDLLPITGIDAEDMGVHGNDRVGGIVGWNAGSVSEAQSRGGSIDGADQVGGIVGWNDGSVSDVTGENFETSGTGFGIGGLVGNNTVTGTVTNSIVDGAFGDTYDIDHTHAVGSWIGGAVGANAGVVDGVQVKDATVGFDFFGSGLSTVGGLVGNNLAGGLVENSFVSNQASVEAGTYSGGFAGRNSGTLSNDVSSAEVDGGTSVGGLVGANLLSGVIEGSDAMAAFVTSSGSRAGGLVGYNAGSILGSGATFVDVFGNNQVGGLVGWNDGSITASSVDVDEVSGSGSTQGGFVGQNTTNATISDSSVLMISGAGLVGNSQGTGATGGFVGDNQGTITGSSVAGLTIAPTGSPVGGFAGRNESSGEIATSTVDSTTQVEGGTIVGGFVGSNAGIASSSESDATVSGTTYVGGFAGQILAGATTQNDIATGSVTATGNYSGGFAGSNAAEIDGSSASGTVIGVSDTGGFVGWNKSTGTIDDGAYNGTSHTVSGTNSVGGLVGLNDGLIKDGSNVTLSDVEGTGYGIGGIVGLNSSTGHVNDSSVDGGGSGTIGLSGGGIGGAIGDNAGHADGDSVSGLLIGTGTQTTIGGFTGKNEATGVITNGSVDSASVIEGLTTVGGFVGANSGDIETSESDAATSGQSYVGGFAGSNLAGTASKLVGDTATGTTTGTAGRTGGLVGWNAGSITTGLAEGAVIGFDQTGGLVGWNDGSISDAGAVGEVTASDYAAGGLVGYATGTSVLNDVYATGNVDGAASAEGGLIGVNNGSVKNAFATGAVGVSGTHQAGGLIGVNSGALTDIFATGSVTGVSGTIGALIATNQASGTVTNGYYDTLVTGGLTSIGVNYNSAGAHPHALTVAHPPTSASSYTGFDFTNHWQIQPGQTPTLIHAPTP